LVPEIHNQFPPNYNKQLKESLPALNSQAPFCRDEELNNHLRIVDDDHNGVSRLARPYNNSLSLPGHPFVELQLLDI
jgi:hypothetical protein